jgi:hypothetical protein
MTELETLLKSVEGRVFTGPATESIFGPPGALDHEEPSRNSLRCGPPSLYRIKLLHDPKNAGDAIVRDKVSMQNGCSLLQVAELSQGLGWNYQMVYREKGITLMVPSFIRWKVGHYAALVSVGKGSLSSPNPTFQKDVCATKAALEAETTEAQNLKTLV